MSLDDALADALAEWAASVALPEATVNDIHQRIVATPATPAAPPPAPSAGVPGLDPAWWRGFTVEFTERIVTSTRPVVLLPA